MINALVRCLGYTRSIAKIHFAIGHRVLRCRQRTISTYEACQCSIFRNYLPSRTNTYITSSTYLSVRIIRCAIDTKFMYLATHRGAKSARLLPFHSFRSCRRDCAQDSIKRTPLLTARQNHKL